VLLPFTPLEVGYQRELLVNNEKFLTGQAAPLSNGVKGGFGSRCFYDYALGRNIYCPSPLTLFN
jgi:hypothetical protein